MSVSQGCLVFVGFVSLLCLVSIELLGSWIPNRAKYFWCVFTQLSFPVFFFFFFLDDRTIGKGGTGQFANEVLGGKGLVSVWILCLSKTGGAEVIATSCLL